VTILITGGAGFIGSNLVRHLLNCGQKVRILDDFSMGLKSNLADLDVEIFQGSILNRKIVKKSLEGVDSVVHLAALGSVPRSLENPIKTQRVNVDGTLNLLEELKGTSTHFIYASSSSVYGASNINPKNESHLTRPISPYGSSKLSAESYVLSYLQSFQLKALSLRFFNVYGPFQRSDHAYSAVIPKLVTAALQRKALIVYGTGNQVRDFTHVHDVVSIIGKAIIDRTSYESPLNLAFGKPIRILDLISEIEHLMGDKLNVKHVPARPGDILESFSDPTLMKKIFEVEEHVNIRDGLETVISWLSSSKK
jgi:UDP-glucose 4-epimerase